MQLENKIITMSTKHLLKDTRYRDKNLSIAITLLRRVLKSNICKLKNNSLFLKGTNGKIITNIFG